MGFFSQYKQWFIVALTVLVTAGAIYLTPLKHVNVLDPYPNDIDPLEFWTAYQAHPDDYLFVDVRDRSAYDIAHARGAISYPIGTLFDLRHAFPKDKTIVLICTSGRLAGVAYGFLQNWGYTNLRRIEGGMQKWSLEKLPLEGTDILAPLPAAD